MSDRQILGTLAGYLWPADNPEFRSRVLGALGLLVASKLLNVQVGGAGLVRARGAGARASWPAGGLGVWRLARVAAGRSVPDALVLWGTWQVIGGGGGAAECRRVGAWASAR
jgi:hypothetical protein